MHGHRSVPLTTEGVTLADRTTPSTFSIPTNDLSGLRVDGRHDSEGAGIFMRCGRSLRSGRRSITRMYLGPCGPICTIKSPNVEEGIFS